MCYPMRTVFLPNCSIAALPHFFRKCRTIISPKGPKSTKEKKNKTYAHTRTFPYNISQNLIGYGVFTLAQSYKMYVKIKYLLSKKVQGIYSNSGFLSKTFS